MMQDALINAETREVKTGKRQESMLGADLREETEETGPSSLEETVTRYKIPGGEWVDEAGYTAYVKGETYQDRIKQTQTEFTPEEIQKDIDQKYKQRLVEADKARRRLKEEAKDFNLPEDMGDIKAKVAGLINGGGSSRGLDSFLVENDNPDKNPQLKRLLENMTAMVRSQDLLKKRIKDEYESQYPDQIPESVLGDHKIQDVGTRPWNQPDFENVKWERAEDTTLPEQKLAMQHAKEVALMGRQIAQETPPIQVGGHTYRLVFQEERIAPEAESIVGEHFQLIREDFVSCDYDQIKGTGNIFQDALDASLKPKERVVTKEEVAELDKHKLDTITQYYKADGLIHGAEELSDKTKGEVIFFVQKADKELRLAQRMGYTDDPEKRDRYVKIFNKRNEAVQAMHDNSVDLSLFEGPYSTTTKVLQPSEFFGEVKKVDMLAKRQDAKLEKLKSTTVKTYQNAMKGYVPEKELTHSQVNKFAKFIDASEAELRYAKEVGKHLDQRYLNLLAFRNDACEQTRGKLKVDKQEVSFEEYVA